jgi:hypothetical protein
VPRGAPPPVRGAPSPHGAQLLGSQGPMGYVVCVVGGTGSWQLAHGSRLALAMGARGAVHILYIQGRGIRAWAWGMEPLEARAPRPAARGPRGGAGQQKKFFCKSFLAATISRKMALPTTSSNGQTPLGISNANVVEQLRGTDP